MNHEKEKFIMEMRLLIDSFPHYSIGEIIYSIVSGVGLKSDLLGMSDDEMIDLIEKTKMREGGR